jgi:hypothetical protein
VPWWARRRPNRFLGVATGFLGARAHCFLWMAAGLSGGWIGSEDSVRDGVTISNAVGAKARCVRAAQSVRRPTVSFGQPRGFWVLGSVGQDRDRCDVRDGPGAEWCGCEGRCDDQGGRQGSLREGCAVCAEGPTVSSLWRQGFWVLGSGSEIGQS